jgi:hypothetical protein
VAESASVRENTGANHMNIDTWQAVAIVASGAATWAGCRWWYLRRVNALTRQLRRLDAAQQSAVQMGAQARKQIEEMQRLLTEYRRRLTSAEQGRARRTVAVPAAAPAAEPVEFAETISGAAPFAPRPGGWADTQPM